MIKKIIISGKVHATLFLIIIMITYSFAQVTTNYRIQDSKEVQDFKAKQQQEMQNYLAQFEKENKEFVKTLAGMPRDKKILAVKDFILKQYNKNCLFRKKMYEEQRAFIQRQLNDNPNIQPFMKKRMLSRIDQDYQELKDFHAGKIKQDMEFLDWLLKDKSIDGQELDKKLQEFFKSQKADAQEFLSSQQQKYRFRQEDSFMPKTSE
ncbi:MAG: hypothetical protein NC908_03290 [Candidatus Omnitrophica bacterium]|nr:hypothetical protein [Candidatus Omnitrophota bacterium]